MFCLNSGRSGLTCQCSVDFLTGVPYVQVMDQLYKESICLPPLMVNDSCLYDSQCQAIDANTVCANKHIDSIDSGLGICQCSEGMSYQKSSCLPIEEERDDTKPNIIWWIFTTDEKSDSSSSGHHRFWWLRTASYLTAVLAIFLPLSLIFVALVILCYKRVAAKRMSEVVVRPKFPSAATPKLMISDFIKGEKSDDKYDLVKNDHLIHN